MIPINKQEVGSFTIDHTNLKPGVYVAREGDCFTTFDIRITTPNKEPAMCEGAAHSLEHMCATFLRNLPDFKEDVIAFDGMMCMTGFYLIMRKTSGIHYTYEDIREAMMQCMQWVLEQTEVPATTPQTCGNYLLHDLPMAKWEAARYLDRLQNDFHHEYIKLEVILDNGMKFADA